MTRTPEPPEGGRVDPHLEVRQRRVGRRPGDAYVRIVRPFEEHFQRGEHGEALVATERTVLQRPGWTRPLRALRTRLIGRPISTEQEGHERLTKVKALAIFSSDNISSSAYGPEEIMRVLAVAGTGALTLTLPLAALITVMLAVVTISYRQTIRAYPQGASAYIVASDNLGPTLGILAAAALLIGYVVTVAVSVSAGVAALTSIVPELLEYRVLIGVGVVALLMLGNLRGIRESGTIFMIPTYAYIVVLLSIIGYGVVRTVTGSVPPFEAPASWAAVTEGSQALGLFLILRAFSQGAVALTGVEAISDGVPAFKPPEWQNARTTLTWAAVVFATLFLGIAYLVTTLRIVPDPNEEQTVLSLLVRHLTGDGAVLVIAQIATVLILILAANTSFADFPRLSSFLARDSYLPRQFAFRGERLAFTTGIVALSAMAAGLIWGFGAKVSALIPLYTLGVFVAFTLSQTGMLVRWWHRREPGWRNGLLINGLGAATTAVVTVVVGTSNFFNGAWLVIVLVPLLMLLLFGIRSHYVRLEAALRLDRIPEAKEVAAKPIVIVPIARLDRPALQAIAFANSISDEAVAVHITNDPETAARIRERWPSWASSTELVIVESPYRALIGPLLAYMDALQNQAPDRPILVVLNEVVPRHWWENLLHNQTALRLKLRLFVRRNTIVADVPYHPPDESP
ncbi:MAG TPA: APC family permease [Candidatus Limnocylindria bacterium]|nr:APC family permease [Candidatus Limnocylindria bacterium]